MPQPFARALACLLALVSLSLVNEVAGQSPTSAARLPTAQPAAPQASAPAKPGAPQTSAPAKPATPQTSAPAQIAINSGLEVGVDRPFNDYRMADLAAPSPELCQQACMADNMCRAFTYVKPGAQGPKERCWLKSNVSDPVKNDCCVSGVKSPSTLASNTASAPNLTGQPQFSPTSLDFGEVWNGQSTTRTLQLTAIADGYVRVDIPSGPFRVAAIREYGAPGGGRADVALSQANTPNSSVQASTAPTANRVQKGNVTFAPGPGPWTASATSGDEVDVDLVFEPKFDLAKMTAGPKTAAMSVQGPGPKANWTLSVPMRGTFDGLVVSAAMVVDNPQIVAVQGTAQVDVNVRVTGTDSVLKGTVQGANLPAGVQIKPVPVTVNPAQTTSAKIPVSLNWGPLAPDAKDRIVNLTFEANGKTSSAMFTLVPVPTSVSAGEAKRTNCGVQQIGWLAQLYPTGRVLFTLRGDNLDLVNNRNVIGIVNIANQSVAWGVVHFKLGSDAHPDTQWDSVNIVTNVDFASRFRAEDYVAAARGPISLTCQLIDSNYKFPF
jgi:hypothetical protein